MRQNNNIDKGIAIAMVNQKIGQTLNHANTIFSNINSAKDVWWFVSKNSRLMNDFYLLLNNSTHKKIYYFFIPGGTIKEPMKIFRQRKTNRSHIEIRIDDKLFYDSIRKQFSFSDYLQGEITY